MTTNHPTSSGNGAPTGWELYDGSRRLDPWEIIPGCDGWNDNDARKAARDGVKLYKALYTAPDNPEVREHNQAAREQWEAEQESKRKAQWHSLETRHDDLNKRLAGYAKKTIDGIIKDVTNVQNGPYWANTIFQKAGQLAWWFNQGFTPDETEANCKAELLAAAAPRNAYEKDRAEMHIDNGWAKPITPDIPTEILNSPKPQPGSGINVEVRKDRNGNVLHASEEAAGGERNESNDSVDGGSPETHDAETEGNADEDTKEQLIHQKLFNLEVLDEARTRLRIAKARQLCETTSPPETLTDFLAVPDEEQTYRIDELLPTGGRVILSAQYKAGKTSLVHNIVKAIVDNRLFLKEFGVQQGKVALIDTEMDERQMRRWMRAHTITNTGNVLVKPLRGAVSTFNILDPEVLTMWTEWLTGYDVIILDCLRPVLDALGLSEDHDAGKFLVAFDELLKRCRASEAILADHMGHSGERTRGDSRKLDWPDVTWRIVRDKDSDDLDNPNVDRYFSGYGRDVNVAEGLLDYTPETRELSYVARSRNADKVSRVAKAVTTFVRAKPGATTREIEQAEELATFTRQQVRDGIKKALDDRDIIAETEGKNHAKKHFVNPSRNP